MQNLTPSAACVSLIEASEDFCSKPYLCPAGIPTIGFGSTRYEDGRTVALKDAPIDRARAERLMLAVLAAEYAPAVRRYVIVTLTQGQFDALVDFAYNCGTQNLRTSTLLRLLNSGDYAGAAAQFDRWTRANGEVLGGLVKRRAAERRLFERRAE